MASKRKRPHETSPSSAIMAESPVPGVNLELASLLVQAVKARRKFLSKSLSSATATATNSSSDNKNADVTKVSSTLQIFQDKANDATTSFLNELRRQADQHSSQSKKKPGSASNSVTHCLTFLLEITSENNNSFHLRRSALALTREILERSSYGRMYFASERHLLEFISMVENCEEIEWGGNDSFDGLSSKAIFQQEAIDLIHHLGAKYGKFYVKFVVASRILGQVSVSLSMNENDESSDRTNVNSHLTGSEDGCDIRRKQGGRQHMQMLRRSRDAALQHGAQICLIVENMVDKGDELLRTIVPRFGGFIDGTLDEEQTEKRKVKSPEMNTLEGTLSRKISSTYVTTNNTTTFIGMNNAFDVEAGIEIDKYDEDDGSIEWEEGDIDFTDENDYLNDGSILSANEPLPETSHQEAVERTLTVMERSGVLLDGEIDIPLGISDSMNSAIDSTNITNNVSVNDSKTTSNDNSDSKSTARGELHVLINKLSAKYLPRVKRWIHALSHADGMVERSVSDPASAPGTIGPASLILLPRKQRSLRGPILQHILKLKGRIDHLIELTARLGIYPNGHGNNAGAGQINNNNQNSTDQSKSRHLLPVQRNVWLKGNFVIGIVETITKQKEKKKQPKGLKLKVLYNNK